MVHLVYCDDKSKELNKIIDGSKTMIIRGAAGRKIHIYDYHANAPFDWRAGCADDYQYVGYVIL